MSSPPSDLSTAARWVAALERTSTIAQDPYRTLPRVIDEIGERFGEAPALIGQSGTLTHRDLAGQSRQYGRWALNEGLGPNDVVGLLMPNDPAYAAAWLGIIRSGATVSLLNTNLVGASLAHCINLVAPTHLIVEAGLQDALEGAAPFLAAQPRIWVHGQEAERRQRIDLAVADLPADPLPETRSVSLSDRALCIYTSGTTSLPKAANVSHHRLMSWSHWFAGLLDVQPADRMYNCLPMYHSIGGVVATFAPLLGGGSVLVRRGFSASEFWDDVVPNECTLFQYIGELCRYLLKAPSHPSERDHRLRICCGNGLRADVWEPFQERFAVPRIIEYYAATEGTVSLYNIEGKVGSVGRFPAFLAHRSPATIVRYDAEAGEPVRDDGGHCVRCAPGEAGELIGRIADGQAHAQSFEGYTSPDEGARKVIRDAFRPGDAWLRTGDLMRMDASGFFYFVDRVGDTFRWKGENVATAEVAEVIGRVKGVDAVAVYGVCVPFAEGRAGMAAVIPGPDFDLAALRTHLALHLPAYARPVFLRLAPAIETTETFKLKTGALKHEGFDPTTIAEPIYVDDVRAGAYVPLSTELYGSIRRGERRL